MAKHSKTTRRLIAGTLVVLGAVLMLAAPNTWSGFLMLGAGIAIELVGLTLEKKPAPQNKPPPRGE